MYITKIENTRIESDSTSSSSSPYNPSLLSLIAEDRSFSAFQLNLSSSEWRKAAKFIFNDSNIPTGVVAVGYGATHFRLLRWDGSYSSPKLASGDTSFSAADWGSGLVSPYNSYLPKFGAILPCDSNGTLTGDLTYVSIGGGRVTSFSGLGLDKLVRLSLSNLKLSSFSGANMSSLETLYLSNNKITIFDGSGLSSLKTIYLSTNQLTSAAHDMAINSLPTSVSASAGSWNSQDNIGAPTSESLEKRNSLIAAGWSVSI